MPDFSIEVKNSKFDVNDCTLVEASAGTGKTYNIQNAYLRLVLEQDLDVTEILVVTFTEAATHELRERLRKILRKARDYMENKLAKDDEDSSRLEEIIDLAREKTADPELLVRLKLALMDFDNAAIFTIHGFCKRVLDHYAFECGHDPAAELVSDESKIIWSTCMDWWRGKTYQTADFRKELPFKDPEELQSYLKEYLKRPDATIAPILKDNAEDWSDLSREVIAAADAFTAMLNDDASPYVKPNANAGRLLNDHMSKLKDILSAKDIDQYELRLYMNGMRTDLVKACVQQPIDEFPKEISRVALAAQEAWGAIGSMAGGIVWTSKHELQRGNNAAVDLEPLSKVIHADRAAVCQWLKEPEPEIKGTKGVTAFIAGLHALCDEVLSWPDSGDAKPFCEILKAVGSKGESDIFVVQKPLLTDIAPEFCAAFHDVKDRLLGEMSSILESLGDTVRENVRKRAVLTFNDLLRNMLAAIKDEEAGPRLQEVLRDEFRAALVDEFQDTDPVQYSIFDLLFRASGVPLFFVGDPKQAIYGFRGGDVFTYYKAKKSVDPNRLLDLGTNFRSEKNLVEAVNELFKDGDEPTFIHSAIPYDGSLKPNDVPDERALLINGKRAAQPLVMKTYNIDGNSVPGAASDYAMRIYSDTADEIVRLMQDDSVKIGESPVMAKDIAILVTTHDEADFLYNALKDRGVNAVRQSTGNVFDTTEANELAVVLAAMLEPGDAYAVRGALATSLLPCPAGDLYRFCMEAASPAEEIATYDEGIPESLEDWMEVIKLANERWRKRSFIEAFRFLVNRLDLKTHIAGMPDGERRLTNLLHLAELAHQAASEYQQGPVSLTAWYKLQLSDATREEKDENEIRLSSDDDAVKIMTIFKSKGLEFPIVFVPTMWRKKAASKHPNSNMLTYHRDGRVMMDLDVDNGESKELARQESLQENLRLIYVALTRGVNMVYLTCLDKGDPADFAIQRLITQWDMRVVDKGDSLIKMIEPGDAPQSPLVMEPVESDPDKLSSLTDRNGEPKVDKSHGHTSFSSIEPEPRETMEVEPRDVDDEEDVESGESKAAEDIFSIPGGARAGNCWHDIFENIDFQSGPDEIRLVTEQELDRYGICKGPTEEISLARREAVHGMVARVLDAPLVTNKQGDSFNLRQIPMHARRSELQFHFALKQQGEVQDTSVIRSVIEKHWKDRHSFLAALEDWDNPLPLGFMIGFIDLVCCHDGRFYIFDWKSNRRTGDIRDFGKSGLMDEMARKAYFLQYLIYTAALHGFLSRELKGYSYNKHMGGSFYVFLRGVTDETGHGIFSDRPSEAMINDLAAVLTVGEGGLS